MYTPSLRYVKDIYFNRKYFHRLLKILSHSVRNNFHSIHATLTQRYYWVEIKHFLGLLRHKTVVFNNMAAVARCYDTMLPIDTPSLLRRSIYGMVACI